MTNKTKDALAYINDQIEHAERFGEDCEVLYEIREAVEAGGLASGFVQNLKRNVEEPIGFDYGDFDIDVIHLLESNGWDNCIDYLQSQGYLTLPVPEGYVLVPVEPTDNILDAMEEQFMPFGEMSAAYDAMISAAPKVESEWMPIGTKSTSTSRIGCTSRKLHLQHNQAYCQKDQRKINNE